MYSVRRSILTNCHPLIISSRLISNKFITILEEKQLIKDWLPQNKLPEIKRMFETKQTLYTGIDPTGPSLHVGNLMVIMTLLHALRNGHRVICLIGDATATIGDPSGKLKERESIDRKTIDSNASRISAALSLIFVNHLKYFWKPHHSEPIHEPIIVQNSSWYKDTKILDFLSEVGSFIKVRNLARKSFVEDRSVNLTFSQFTYQVIQGYDWLRLYDKHDCRFQVGGADQTHNIEAGFSLIRNSRGQEAYGLFVPLLVDKDGNKMGKTEGKSLFLDRFINSPYLLYKTILKLPHSQVRKFLQYFTFYDEQQIEGIIQKSLKSSKNFHAHEKLAESLTLLVHGESGLNQAKNTIKALLHGDWSALGQLTEDDLVEVFGKNSFIHHELIPEVTTLLSIINKTKCFDNEELAVITIRKGGIFINGKKTINEGHTFTDADVLPNNLTTIKIGTNRVYLIRWL